MSDPTTTMHSRMAKGGKWHPEHSNVGKTNYLLEPELAAEDKLQNHRLAQLSAEWVS